MSIVRRACLLVAMFAGTAACDESDPVALPADSTPTQVTATEAAPGVATSASSLRPAPPVVADGPVIVGGPSSSTTSPDGKPDGCRRTPVIELVSRTDLLAMDLIFYGESTATCGWDVDGEAMFDDAFRPAAALVVPLGDGELATCPTPLAPSLSMSNR